MALTKCTECGGKVSTTAEVCPHCGYILKKQKKKVHTITLVGHRGILDKKLIGVYTKGLEIVVGNQRAFGSNFRVPITFTTAEKEVDIIFNDMVYKAQNKYRVKVSKNVKIKYCAERKYISFEECNVPFMEVLYDNEFDEWQDALND